MIGRSHASTDTHIGPTRQEVDEKLSSNVRNTGVHLLFFVQRAPQTCAWNDCDHLSRRAGHVGFTVTQRNHRAVPTRPVDARADAAVPSSSPQVSSYRRI